MKKRRHSAKDDMKTGYLAKICLLLGIISLIIFIVLYIVSLVASTQSTGFLGFLYSLSQSTIPSASLAFAIIFIGIGIILTLLHRQFEKLSEIAQDVEDAKYDEITEK